MDFLPPNHASLAGGVPPAPVGTLFALGSRGGVAAPPRPDFPVLFGRNEPDVHICLGPDDPRVSRCHGRLLCDGHGWWLRNEGKLPIRLPRANLLVSGEELPLADGYSALFIKTAPRLEHLLEIWIVGSAPPEPTARPDDPTLPRRPWPLSDAERLVLTALAQRYLRQEAYPQPLSWKQVAEELDELAEPWTGPRPANVVGEVRERLHRSGVSGLTRGDVPEPVGNALNHNLIVELLETTSLVPPDLRLLGDA
ncbi:MAG: FHA domain-containing protein [Nonomuraea sp.]|nr:FHA domain-containing protein [Nonomuraea sp.]